MAVVRWLWNPEGVAQAQVDRGQLHVVGVPRVDRDPAGGDQAPDRAVGQHGLGSGLGHGPQVCHGMLSRWPMTTTGWGAAGGRHSRDRAKPEFWRNQWQAIVATSILGVLVIVVVIVALLS